MGQDQGILCHANLQIADLYDESHVVLIYIGPWARTYGFLAPYRERKSSPRIRFACHSKILQRDNSSDYGALSKPAKSTRFKVRVQID